MGAAVSYVGNKAQQLGRFVLGKAGQFGRWASDAVLGGAGVKSPALPEPPPDVSDAAARDAAEQEKRRQTQGFGRTQAFRTGAGLGRMSGRKPGAGGY